MTRSPSRLMTRSPSGLTSRSPLMTWLSLSELCMDVSFPHGPAHGARPTGRLLPARAADMRARLLRNGRSAADLRWEQPLSYAARTRDMPEFSYTDLLPTGPDDTEYRLLTEDGIRRRVSLGREFLEVDPGVLTLLAADAMRYIAHLLRPAHLRQLRAILDDPEASGNDRFVAGDLDRSEERRGGKGVDIGGRRIIKTTR